MSDFGRTDEDWMRMALAHAREAGERGEVPVGAVVVRQGKLIASSANAPITTVDPTAHAEIGALRAAALKLGNYRLEDCELYVTLEPCAMCAGAMLNARLKRVVYGAPEPRTGAGGSILNLFAERRLNHQTELAGPMLQEECAAALKEFFQARRANPNPLRDDAVRTPDKAFAGLPHYPWQGAYTAELPALNGLRLHYLDEGVCQSTKSVTWLCVHASPLWSYFFHPMVSRMTAAGDRVVAPDLPGFGKSDKPKKEQAHRLSWHRQVLLELIEHLDLRNVVLVVHGRRGGLGLTLPCTDPSRFRGLVTIDTTPAGSEDRRVRNTRSSSWVGTALAQSGLSTPAQDLTAYEAPFPDRGHGAAVRAFANPLFEGDDAQDLKATCAFWKSDWNGEALLVQTASAARAYGTDVHPLLDAIRGSVVSAVVDQTLPEAMGSIAELALRHFHPRDEQQLT